MATSNEVKEVKEEEKDVSGLEKFAVCSFCLCANTELIEVTQTQLARRDLKQPKSTHIV